MDRGRIERARGTKLKSPRRFPSSGLVRHALLAVWVIGVGLLTLLPGDVTPALTWDSFLCIGCGWRGNADILLNVLLFLPGGALAARTLGPGRTVVLAACLTVFIEVLQVGIPGRSPDLQDLLSNTAGSILGLVLAHRGLGVRARRLLAGTCAVVWLAPLLLAVPITTDGVLHGMWSPVRGGTKYEGVVLAAHVGDLAVPPRLSTQPDSLRAALGALEPIELSVELGPPPARLASVFEILAPPEASVLALEALHHDLFLTMETRAHRLKLDQPSARWAGALRAFAPGDTIRLVIERARGSTCMSIDGEEACRLSPGLGDGWGFLLYSPEAPAWTAVLLGLFWPMFVGFSLGASCAGTRAATTAGLLVSLAGLGGAMLSPHIRHDPLDAALLFAGAVLGSLARRGVAGAWASLIRVGAPGGGSTPTAGLRRAGGGR